MTDFPSDEELMAGPSAVEGMSLPQTPEDFVAGFATIVGRPNVGKSTLTNAIVGKKIAITSMRPETTRHTVRGVHTSDEGQLVLLDTPGYHRPRTLLGKRLNDQVREALTQVDLVFFCIPADQKIGPGDRFIARELKSVKVPVIAVVTKSDLVGPERLLPQIDAVSKLGDWAEIVPTSAAKGRQVDDLISVAMKYLPKSMPLYPLDAKSDESDNTMIAEFFTRSSFWFR